MEFEKFLFQLCILIFLKICILCQTLNFKVIGNIEAYENTFVTRVCCQGKCINYTSSNPSKIYPFNFSISTLKTTIDISVQNINYIPGSRIGAFISSTIKNGNDVCGNPNSLSETVYLKGKLIRNYLSVQNYTKFYELPENMSGIYTINYNYDFKEKYSCNSQSTFIKKNISSSFYLSSLVVTLESVNSLCCNEYNATITKVDSGFTLYETDEIILNTVYQNPHLEGGNQKINFINDQIGCYSFQFLLNQENYQTTNTCYKTFIICYKTCQTCYDCNGNENDHKCNQCIEGYYKKVDGNNNCYTEEEKRQLFPNYFLNKDINKFDKCYSSCGTCRLKGNKNKHKCDTCAENYYPTEGNEYLFNCYNDFDKPKNYFFDNDKKLYVKCSSTCNECSEKGNKNNNNCTTCIRYHHFFEKEPGNCIMEGTQPLNFYLDEQNNTYQECYERCKTCSKYKDDNSENCISCDQEQGFYLIYDQPGNCVDDKPGPDYYLNPINFIQKKFEKCNHKFCAECSNDKWYYISRFIGKTFYCENNNEEKSFNMQIYKNSEPLINKSQSYINSLDVIKCENILKNQSLLTKREEIIVVKKDYINTTTNEIEKIGYDFYKKKKNSGILELSTFINNSLCNDIGYFITIPRNLSNYYSSKYINIVKTAFEKFNYDLFNSKDPFYTDICIPFFINSADLSIKDRYSLYLKNNLCPENCIYHSLVYIDDNYLSEINCVCDNISSFRENGTEIEIKKDYFIKNNITNIGIMKCLNSFGQSLKLHYFNLSFILYLIILIVYIYLIFRYFFVDMHKFRSKIFDSLRKSHSSYRKLERNDSSIINERLELYNNNSYINFDTKILSLTISKEVNLNNMPYEYSLTNDFRGFISTFYSILKDIDFLFGIFLKKNQFKILSLSICIFIHHINFMFILNSIFIFDNIISYKCLYDIFPMKKILLNAIILICIHLILVKFVYKYCFKSEKLMEFLIEEYKNNSLYFSKIQNFIISYHQKIITMFIITLLFIFFGIYYNIIFCYIFVKSQLIWFIQIIFCCIGCLLVNCIASLIITSLRILSFKYQKLYIYNASLILKGVLNRD